MNQFEEHDGREAAARREGVVDEARQRRIDLLNETHAFPTTVLFKVIGTNDPQFILAVLEAIREVLELAEHPSHQLREARGGRHIAISLEPPVQHAEQVLNVYARLSLVEGVVMML
jgi:putative lipoic acid-binding regulatory protein